MSYDSITQLTLNCLISDSQLQKLNKRMNETTVINKNPDNEKYKDRIQKLFDDLLKGDAPVNILPEVHNIFELFSEKCIYYFKSVDNNELLEKTTTTTNCDIESCAIPRRLRRAC